MARRTTATALATLALAATACATTPSENKDVVAVVQNEPARQAVVDAAKDGKTADQALSQASEAATPKTEAPR